MAFNQKLKEMTKLNLSLINPNFLDEAGDYLIANGFKFKQEGRAFHFVKGDVGVFIMGDSADFLRLNEGEEFQRASRLEPILQVTRIGNIDNLFDWMLLLHVSDVIPINKFVAAVRRTGIDPIGDLMRHFRVTEDKDSVPVAY